MSFKQSVGIGRTGEDLIISLLNQAQIPNRRNPEKSNRAAMALWDIAVELDGRKFTIETKFDAMEAKTGNVAIEYYNPYRGCNSGIMATTSDLWAIVLQGPTTAWLCRTADLRNYFGSAKCHRNIKCGGDNNASMKLFRRTVIFDVLFHRIDLLSPEELVNLLTVLLKDHHAKVATTL